MTRIFTALIFPSTELKDVWLGHCLELDIVTQGAPGKGSASACAALTDAISLVFQRNREETVKKYKPAPEDVWNRYRSPAEGDRRFLYEVELLPSGRYRVDGYALLGRHTITITARSHDYHACIDSDERLWEAGRTVDEAIGKIVRTRQETLGIVILDRTFDQKPPEQC